MDAKLNIVEFADRDSLMQRAVPLLLVCLIFLAGLRNFSRMHKLSFFVFFDNSLMQRVSAVILLLLCIHRVEDDVAIGGARPQRR